MGTLFAALLLGSLTLAGQAFAQTQEQEPNDNPATATAATRGSFAKGSIAPYNETTGYDVGDLRAYLIRSGTLAASPVRKP